MGTAACLNPIAEHNDNAKDAVSCKHCGFLIRDAQIAYYKVVSFIDAGSYGQVYAVQEPEPLNRILALKVLQYGKVTRDALKEFFKEAERIAKLQHPNVLPIYHFGQLDNWRPYYVMEYAKNNLFNLFRNSHRKPDVKEMMPYVIQAAEALTYIHNNGYVHLDVKPINLLIGNRGQLFLSDFGISLELGENTHLTLQYTLGTRFYMAPEQFVTATGAVSRRESDQYALAATFYHLLAGRPPFNYRDPWVLERAIHIEEPPPPQTWNPRIPPEVGGVLLRALSKDHRNRYRSVQDFAEDYRNEVEISLKRYYCLQCESQNNGVTVQCNHCGATHDNRPCPYCETMNPFGQRCCSRCNRLIFTATTTLPNPFLGLGVQEGRYVFKRALKDSEKTKVLVAVSHNPENFGQKVVLKRWQCNPAHLAEELVRYFRQSEPLTQLPSDYPFIPHVLERFHDETFYYLAMTYIDGETLEERLQRLLKPLPEKDVLQTMNTLINILAKLEQQQPPLRHYDISPANIIFENLRERPCLVGFQILSPILRDAHKGTIKGSTTNYLTISPYLPALDPLSSYDQRTCIYLLAACMHQALTNYAPPHFPVFPPVRQFNPTVSPELEIVLARALMENREERYQNYEELQRDIKNLLLMH